MLFFVAVKMLVVGNYVKLLEFMNDECLNAFFLSIVNHGTKIEYLEHVSDLFSFMRFIITLQLFCTGDRRN